MEKVGFEVLRKDSRNYSTDPSSRYSLQAYVAQAKNPASQKEETIGILPSGLTCDDEICVRFQSLKPSLDNDLKDRGRQVR